MKRENSMAGFYSVYSVENKRRIETSDDYMYEVTQLDNIPYTDKNG